MKDPFVEALSYTTALALFKNPGFEPFGSGILLSIEDDIFLISAGHCFTYESWPQISMPGKDNTMINLRHGELNTTLPEGGTGKMDIAILKFGSNMHKYVKDHYNLVTINNVSLGYQPRHGEELIFTGYPITKTKRKGRNFMAYPFKFYTRLQNDSYFEKLGIEKGCFIITQYRKRIIDDNGIKFFAPDLTGISGSGLWAIIEGEIKLIGINTEYNKEMGYILSVRIDVVLSLIKTMYGYKSIPHVTSECFVGDIFKVLPPEGTDLYIP